MYVGIKQMYVGIKQMYVETNKAGLCGAHRILKLRP